MSPSRTNSALALIAGGAVAFGVMATISTLSPATAQPGAARPRAAATNAPAWQLDLLTPDNCVLALIDHQPQMAFGTFSHDRQAIKNNVVALAEAAKVFNVPTVLTTVAAQTFSGPIWPEIQAVYPDQKPIDRTTMNSWEDDNFRKAVQATGKRKLIIAGLWTEVCVAFPTIEALRDGYEVYFVTDASGGSSKEAHDMAVQRMIQAGAVPVTWQQVMLEWQRDWARSGTYDGTNSVVKKYSGAYGMGINYAKTMFNSQGEGGKAKADAKTDAKTDKK